MIPQAARLKKNSDFIRVLGLNNKNKFGPLLVFNGGGQEPARFGFVVSKKVNKKAVVRNHLKRVLTEVVRTGVLPHRISGDWVLMVLFEPVQPFSEFSVAINQWLKKLS